PDVLKAPEVVIELVGDSAGRKQAVIEALAPRLQAGALWLTWAMPTSVTAAAAWAAGPERVIGFGVLPPLSESDPIELAAGLQSSAEARHTAEAFWTGLGFEPVWVAEGPGLVRARILCCLINEAATALAEGISSAEEIDQAMKLGTNYPYGPLEWGDRIGLHHVLGVMEGLFREWGEDRYRPAPLLRRLVQAAFLGEASGRGFYESWG
ncbi:MAG: 3-hydroxyacyl-CoA dehydrogenase family protein, partial [Candidatus Promineifilaceae bacterium]